MKGRLGSDSGAIEMSGVGGVDGRSEKSPPSKAECHGVRRDGDVEPPSASEEETGKEITPEVWDMQNLRKLD